MDERKQVISDLLCLQKSIYDMNEIISWISDIGLTSSSEVFCKDLVSVQSLLRDHEMVENTRSAIAVRHSHLLINTVYLYILYFILYLIEI